MHQMECFKSFCDFLVSQGQCLPVSHRIEHGKVNLMNLREGL